MSVQSSYKQRFTQLNAVLTEYQPYWQLQAFSYLELPWRQLNPELCAWLQGLTSAQLHAYAADTRLLTEQVTPYLANIAQLEELVSLNAIASLPESRLAEPVPGRFGAHIKGRKWEQIQAFERACRCEGNVMPTTLEWCAGKGHLGRLLAWKQGCKVSSVEWQQSLCDEGFRLAKRSELNIDYYQEDVLSARSQHLLCTHQRAVALHACGELHLHLLRMGSAVKTPQLVIAPCCYHLIPQEEYRALSAQANFSGLRLTKADLKLPLQETVVAGSRVQRLRQLELSWRLGFDCLQRDVQGVNRYLPVPSFAKALLSGSFKDFCYWAADKKQLTLPASLRFDHYLQQGQQRLELLTKIELVQQLFKRPLELWLNLDRALFLEEQGYLVQMGEFCQRELTPRNILIKAVYPSSS